MVAPQTVVYFVLFCSQNLVTSHDYVAPCGAHIFFDSRRIAFGVRSLIRSVKRLDSRYSISTMCVKTWFYSLCYSAIIPIVASISTMSLFDHLRDPLSLNPKSLWLEFTSNYPDWTSHFQANLADSSPAEVLSLASKFLLLQSCTSIIADTFRPLLLDLCSRWLEHSEALEDKLSALCFLLQPHMEIFP
jgi:hypothetical protein